MFYIIDFVINFIIYIHTKWSGMSLDNHCPTQLRNSNFEYIYILIWLSIDMNI